MVPVTRVEISPGTTGSWQDVDVSAYVDAGNTAFVVLEIVSKTNQNEFWGARCNGSTDDRYSSVYKYSHTYMAVAVDDDDILEIKLENAFIDVFLVAYATDDEAGALTNGTDVTPDSSGDWVDIDISSDTGDDTAVCAFFDVMPTGDDIGFRQNGSSDDRYDGYHGWHDAGMMACDGSEIVECKIEDEVNMEIYLLCWLTDNFTAITNATLCTVSELSAWEDEDLSAIIDTGHDGAFFHLYYGSADYAGIRKNGTEIDNTDDVSQHTYGWVETDGSQVIEWNSEAWALDLYIWGSTAQPSAGPETLEISVSECGEVGEAVA